MKMKDIEATIGGFGILIMAITFLIIINDFFFRHGILASLFAIGIDLCCVAGFLHCGNDTKDE